MQNKNKHGFAGRVSPAIALMTGSVMMMGVAAPASAISIETGNPDIRLRWDNTFTYNLGVRVEERKDVLGDTWISQATNHGWDQGDVVTNRVDILSEFDLVYKRKHGFRVSATGWNDFAWDDDVKGNPAYQEAGLGTAYPDNKFTDDVERYYKRGGEILDAFVFTEFDVLDRPVGIRAGRHNLYWGESLFSFNSIAYAQGPLDLRKATSTPGTEAKQLFLPQNQISLLAQVTDQLSIGAHYMLEWDPHRLPEGGTYLGGADLSFLGGTNFLGFPYVGDLNSGPYEKPDDRGNWGVNAQFPVDAIDANFGLFYREFDDRYPVQVSTDEFLYNAYAEDVKLYGISMSKLVGSLSVGAELSYRKNTALTSNGAGLAQGDTMHALVNMIAYFGQTPVFDSAALTVELTYDHLDSVSGEDELYFKHEDYACVGEVEDGCVTDGAWGIQMAFEPTWFQVFPGIDMTMPTNFGMGLKGNSATPLGKAEDGGAWSLGVGMDIQARYKVTLAYNDYFGDYSTGPNSLLALDPNLPAREWKTTNGSGLLSDRGWVSLTFKTTY